MVTFPDEVILNIFSFLSHRDLAISIPLVCRRWEHICKDRSLWEILYKKSQRVEVYYPIDVGRLRKLTVYVCNTCGKSSTTYPPCKQTNCLICYNPTCREALLEMAMRTNVCVKCAHSPDFTSPITCENQSCKEINVGIYKKFLTSGVEIRIKAARCSPMCQPCSNCGLKPPYYVDEYVNEKENYVVCDREGKIIKKLVTCLRCSTFNVVNGYVKCLCKNPFCKCGATLRFFSNEDIIDNKCYQCSRGCWDESSSFLR